MADIRYTVAEAAVRVNLSERTIRRYLNEDRIPNVAKNGKAWVIPESSLRVTFPDAFQDNFQVKHDTSGPFVYDTSDLKPADSQTERAGERSELVEELRTALERERARADDLDRELREERAASRRTMSELARLTDQAQQLQLSQMKQPDSISEKPATGSPIEDSRKGRRWWPFGSKA